MEFSVRTDAAEIFYKLANPDVSSSLYLVASEKSHFLKDYLNILIESYRDRVDTIFVIH